VKFIRYESATVPGRYDVINDNGEDSQDVLTFGTGCFSNYIGDVWVLRNIAEREFPNFVIGRNSSSNKVGKLCLNNTWGNFNQDNTWGNNNLNNTWGNFNQNNTWGNNNQSNTWGTGNNNTWGNNNQSNTWGTGNNNNIFTNNISSLDFTSATHVFAAYYCEIFVASDTDIYLKYFDGTQYQFVSPTS
jgi:hypothetical protein